MSSLEQKQETYESLFNKPVPSRYKNDEVWLQGKIASVSDVAEEELETKAEDIPPAKAKDDLKVEGVSVPKRQPDAKTTKQLIRDSGWSVVFAPIKAQHDERRHLPFIAVGPEDSYQKVRNYKLKTQCFPKQIYAEQFILGQLEDNK